MRLDPINPVLEKAGPFITVHVEVGRATADPESQIGARVTTVRHGLEGADVPAALIDDICDRVAENPHLPGLVRRTIVADTESVVFDDLQVGHNPWGEFVDRGPLPHLSPWLAAADSSRSFLLVNVDRVGADLSVHRAAAAPAETEDAVEGADFHITKVPEGDWSQKQFQQTAEDAWVGNARQVADEARTLARERATRATFVAGETRARAEVVRAMEHDAASLEPVVEIDAGGRDVGASDDALWQAVAGEVNRLWRDEDAEVAARLDEAVGRREGAAVGLDEVVAALDQSQVDRLLLDPGALVGAKVATDSLTGVPLPAAARSEIELPADRALVAAAALTGAATTLLPESMTHGAPAALLRWG